jgi:hypothetical protein
VIPLAPEALRVFAADRAGRRDEGLLEFACPSCRRLNLRRLSARDLSVLASVGFQPEPRSGPLELLERRPGPALTWDDVLDFHEAIASSDDTALSRLVGGAEPIEDERHAA